MKKNTDQNQLRARKDLLRLQFLITIHAAKLAQELEAGTEAGTEAGD